MKKWILKLLAFLVLVAALGYLLYPVGREQWEHKLIVA